MTRLLHTADWQIGRQYGRFAEADAAILAQARFEAIATLARLANEHGVAAVLVAGDVFDAQGLSDATLHRAFQATQAFAGPWIMLPGNHDAALAESVWARALRINAVPSNVQVLATPEVQVLDGAGIAILPAPLTQRQTHADLTAWFDGAETPKGLLRIGLAHGSVTGALADLVDAHNPIAADRAATARLDYLALGDWHGCKQINARTWYSGTPEPDRFKDNDAGHALLVELPGPGVEPVVTRLPTARHRWFQWERELAVPGDVDELLHALQELPAESVLSLTLSGALDLADWERLEQALGAAAGRQRSLQVHRHALQLQPTDEDIASLRADGYVGEVVAELRQLQTTGGDAADAAIAGEALALLTTFLRDSPDHGEPA